MPISFLYVLIILIWGSSWIAITYQYGIVSEELSVAYRFFIASMALFAYAFFKQDQLRIKLVYYPMPDSSLKLAWDFSIAAAILQTA